ncbi:MAG: hypothetical protein QOK16_815 [Solirubrobacteraceae bacterium]|nr:hypothetical protein [Solirubrobacteraceae bacterium]
MADLASGDRLADLTSGAIQGQREGVAVTSQAPPEKTLTKVGLRAGRGAATAAALLVGVALVPAVARAAVVAGAQIDVPSNGSSTVTVGQTAIPATLTLRNLNSVPDASATNEVCNVGESSPPCTSPERGITLVPSCKQLAGGQCTAAGADPDVFALSPSGTGQIGSSCGGMPFTMTVIDPVFGTVRFTPPPGSRVSLPGSGLCVIRFTFGVLKSPTGDESPALPGNQTAQAAAHTQFKIPFGPGAPNSFARNTSSGTTVLRAGPPSITTAASDDIYLGGGLDDQATVSSLVNAVPGATVTFRLYPPSAPTCTGTPAFTDTQLVALAGTTATATSDVITPLAAGVYHWIATYDGDANNLPVSGTCAEASETVVVHEPPTISTNASPDIALGAGTLSDSATVNGFSTPQSNATITFRLFGPDDGTCMSTPVFSPAPVPYPDTGGAVTSPAFTPAAAGTYRWIASYSGDAYNPPATSLCDDADERTVVGRSAPTMTTNASSDIVLGTATLLDTATVSGRASPVANATIDFRLYGPDNATCTGTPLFQSPNVPYPVAGGSVSSLSFTPTQSGTYRWIASYSGDANNLPITGSCDGAGQRTVVARATPTITTTASPGITIGAGRLTDSALVSGRVNPQPAATIDFRLYGPGDATCAASPVFESLNIVYPPAGGPVTSAAFAPTQSGAYRWRAFYSGDANNVPVAGACNEATENVLASVAPPRPPAVLSRCLGKIATIVPAAGQTVVTGTRGRDVIVGRDAGERIDGRGGDDTICAGKGNDTVRGGAGNDKVRGGDGNDRLFGDRGDDLLRGDGGNDDLRGGSGKDRTGGGNGRDRVDGGAGNDLLDEQKLGGKGSDRLAGGAGADRVRSADRSRDSVDCGPGRDSARIDRIDRQKRCESIRRLKPPG